MPAPTAGSHSRQVALPQPAGGQLPQPAAPAAPAAGDPQPHRSAGERPAGGEIGHGWARHPARSRRPRIGAAWPPDVRQTPHLTWYKNTDGPPYPSRGGHLENKSNFIKTYIFIKSLKTL